MGEEAHGLYLDGLDEFLPLGPNPDSKGYQTATIIGGKIYVITESDTGEEFSINVRIFCKTRRTWIIPTTLGIKPIPSKGHSATSLNGERILVLKHNVSLDYCTWILEVDTPFVKEQKKIVGSEVVAWSKGVLGDGLKPVVISGPSGVGKGTLISKLMTEFPSAFGFSVSHTTRLPRENEKDGVHYHFAERSKMEKDIQDGKFLETALVHGNLYGTSIEAVETVTDAGKRCVLDIDVQGARSVRASSLEAIFMFVAPPSFEELEKRLRSRGTETEEQVQKRLRNAKAEIEQGKSPGLFDHILVNDNLEACYEHLKKILGLEITEDAGRQPSKTKNLMQCCSISRTEEKFRIHFDTNEPGKETNTSYMLDVSSLKGGAPGRTRGLRVYGGTDLLTVEPYGI